LIWIRPNTLAWLGSFGLVLAGVGILLVRLYSQRRRVFRVFTFAGALLVATAIGSAVAMWPKVKEAVIMVREAPARTSPVLAAEPLFKLREGETVTVRAEHQDFSLVQTAAGRSGWVDRADLSLVVIGDPVKTGTGISELAKAK
jgi:SH3-like domain-containing protein